jgi:hypothetical protein
MHIAFSSEDTQTSVLVALHHPHSTLNLLWQEGKQPTCIYIYTCIISLTKRELSKQGKENEMEKMKNLSPVINRFFYRRDFHLSKQQDTKRKTPLKYYVLNFWGLTRMIIRIFVLDCHTKLRNVQTACSL